MGLFSIFLKTVRNEYSAVNPSTDELVTFSFALSKLTARRLAQITNDATVRTEYIDSKGRKRNKQVFDDTKYNNLLVLYSLLPEQPDLTLEDIDDMPPEIFIPMLGDIYDLNNFDRLDELLGDNEDEGDLEVKND